MSGVKKKCCLLFSVLVFALLVFGCEDKTVAVKNIYFDLKSENSITLLVGESYTPTIIFDPTYADNLNYTLVSEDSSVLSVSGISVSGVKEGETLLTVVASDNTLVSSVVRVYVKNTPQQLETPILTYNTTTQTFNISAINNAVGYTLVVNGDKIELGNITNLTLTDLNTILKNKFNKSAFNSELKLSVCANSYAYTHAYVDSKYSNSIKIEGSTTALATAIYQQKEPVDASVVGGVLTFDASDIDEYELFINGNNVKNEDSVVAQKVDGKININLTNVAYELTDDKANVNILLRAIVKENLKLKTSTFYCDAPAKEINVAVLDTPLVNINDATISWQYVANASNYEVQVGSNNYFTNKNVFNLTEVFDEIGTNEDLEIGVKAIISNKSQNVIQTNKGSNSVKVNKLAEPVLTVANNEIGWESVDNATMYSVELFEIGEEVRVFATTTETKFFNLKGYDSGKDYLLKVVALYTGDTTEVKYLSSSVASVNIFKQAEANGNIENNILTIEAIENDEYDVVILNKTDDIVVASYNGIKGTMVEDQCLISIDLTKNTDGSTRIYSAGQYRISICHKGDGEFVFDSDEWQDAEFTQLEQVTDFALNNNKLTANRSVMNNKAKIVFKLFSEGEELSTLIESTTGVPSYTFTDENALNAGEYEARVYVVGDGTQTLSYMANPNYLSVEFKVLEVPTVTQAAGNVVTLQDEDDTESYNIITTETIHIDNECEFDLSAGQTLKFKVQTVGDGSLTISSKVSNEYSITKLATPSLKYVNNKILHEINNESGVASYKLFEAKEIGYDELEYTLEADLESRLLNAYSALTAGEHIYELKLLAEEKDGYNLYVDSNKCELKVVVVDNSENVYIDAQNRLVVQTVNGLNDAVKLIFTIGTSTLKFEQENGKYVNGDTQLSYTFSDDKYFIPLLDNYCKALIKDLESCYPNNFIVKVEIVCPEESDVNTTYYGTKTVRFETKSSFDMIVRDGQFVVFNNVLEESKDECIARYKLILNNEDVVALPNDVVVDGSNIKVDIGYIYSNISTISDVNTVAIISKNKSTSVGTSTLSVVGDTIKIALTPEIYIQNFKDNDALIGSNSQIIYFEPYISYDYDISYNIVVTDGENTQNLEFDNNSIIDDVISFNLDEIIDTFTFDGSIKIYGYVLTNDEDNDVFMFNSVKSNIVELEKLTIVEDIAVVNNMLHLSHDKAIGFDVFVVGDSGLNKINTQLVTMDEPLDITLLVTESCKIVVRAISDEDGTNSNLSEEFNIVKLEIPTLSTSEEGYLVVELDNISMGLFKNATMVDGLNSIDGCVIGITNGANQEIFVLPTTEGVEIDDNNVIIKPEVVLNSTGVEIVKQILQIRLIACKKDDDNYYINSNTTENSAYMLLSPINLQKSLTNDGISWECVTTIEDDVLTLHNIVDSYVFELTFNGETYLSSDAENKLVYKNGNNYYDYLNLSTKSIRLPYGYIPEGGGNDDLVVFGAGEYSFKIFAKAKQGLKDEDENNINLCTSVFSSVITVRLLKTLEPKMIDGVLAWEHDEKASSYELTIYTYNTNSGDYTSMQSVSLTVPNKKDMLQVGGKYYITYSFPNKTAGVYGFECRAMSTNEYIIDSYRTVKAFVYKEPMVTDVKVDDGTLIVYANKAFVDMEVQFVDTQNKTIQKIICVNEQWESSDNWELESQGDIESCANTVRHIVKFRDSDILQLISGTTYTINIVLKGNDIDALNIVDGKLISASNVGVVSSDLAVNVADLTVNKLKIASGDYEVNKSVLTFAKQNAYSATNINYRIDDITYNQLKLYLIKIDSHDGDEHLIYCVDYEQIKDDYSLLLDNGTIVDVYDETTRYLYSYYNYPYKEGVLKINVYKDNKIDFNGKQIYYFPVEKTLTENNTYTYTNKTLVVIQLTEGGAFDVYVNLLGGDDKNESGNNYAYLTTDVLTVGTFVRYKNCAIGTLNGLLLLDGKLYLDADGNVVDYPVYKLSVKKAGGATEFFYLYYPEHCPSDEWFELHPGSKNCAYEMEITDDGKLTFDISKYLLSGATYDINEQTLHGDGETNGANFLLDAEVGENPSQSQFKKPTDVVFGVDNKGLLTIDQSYVTTTLDNDYLFDYEITVINLDTSEKDTFKINLSTQGVNSSAKGVLTLKFPLITSDEVEHTLLNGGNYTINLKALSSSDGVLNGTYLTTAYEITTSVGVTDVEIKNGKLTWKVLDMAQYATSNIVVECEKENVLYVLNISGSDLGISPDENGVCEYSFNDSYRILNVLFNLDSSNKYKIGVYSIDSKAKTLGSNTVYVEALVERLPSVGPAEIDQVYTFNYDGVLVWEPVEDANHYIVKINGLTYTAKETLNEDGNYYIDLNSTSDDSGNKIVTGTIYSIQIIAVGSTKITSIATEINGFRKLNSVDATSIKISQNASRIEWQAVENVTKYRVVYRYNLVGDVYTETQEFYCQTNYCEERPEDLNGSFEFEVQTIGSGVYFNGSVVSAKMNVSVPKAIESITFDEDNLRLILTTTDYSNDDEIMLKYYYSYATYVNNEVVYNEAQQISETISFKDWDKQEVDGTMYYYYPLTEMGKLVIGESNYSVEVNVYRIGTLISPATQYYDEKVINWYGAGAGTASNPYLLSTPIHLLNIGLMPNAKFKFVTPINMAGIGYSENLTKYNALIASEFGGELDGNSKYLSNLDVNLMDACNVSLFGTLKNGAVIKNLAIVSPKLTISFANEVENVVYLSVIARQSNGAILQNVEIQSREGQSGIISLIGEGSAGSGLYIAGLVANANGTSVINCSVNLTVNIGVQCSGMKYVGGLVAKGSNTSITNSSSTEFNVVANQKRTINYIGGIMAYMDGGTIDNATVYLTQSLSQLSTTGFGGVVGYAINSATIKNSDVSGAIAFNVTTETNVGGVLGYGNNVTLLANEINVDFSNVTTNSITILNIGDMAGKLDNCSGTYIGDYDNGYTTTFKVNSNTGLFEIDNLGLYGNKNGGTLNKAN